MPFGTLAIGHANGNIDLSDWMGSTSEPPSSQGWVVRQVRVVALFQTTSVTHQTACRLCQALILQK